MRRWQVLTLDRQRVQDMQRDTHRASARSGSSCFWPTFHHLGQASVTHEYGNQGIACGRIERRRREATCRSSEVAPQNLKAKHAPCCGRADGRWRRRPPLSHDRLECLAVQFGQGIHGLEQAFACRRNIAVIAGRVVAAEYCLFEEYPLGLCKLDFALDAGSRQGAASSFGIALLNSALYFSISVLPLPSAVEKYIRAMRWDSMRWRPDKLTSLAVACLAG